MHHLTFCYYKVIFVLLKIICNNSIKRVFLKKKSDGRGIPDISLYNPFFMRRDVWYSNYYIFLKPFSVCFLLFFLCEEYIIKSIFLFHSNSWVSINSNKCNHYKAKCMCDMRPAGLSIIGPLLGPLPVFKHLLKTIRAT